MCLPGIQSYRFPGGAKESNADSFCRTYVENFSALARLGHLRAVASALSPDKFSHACKTHDLYPGIAPPNQPLGLFWILNLEACAWCLSVKPLLGKIFSPRDCSTVMIRVRWKNAPTGPPHADYRRLMMELYICRQILPGLTVFWLTLLSVLRI
jgi:hypothetical protein